MIAGVGKLGHGREARGLAHHRVRLRHQLRLFAVHHARHGDRLERHLLPELRFERRVEEEHRLLVHRNLLLAQVRAESREPLDVLAVDLGGGVEPVDRRLGIVADDHVVVAHELEAGLEAGQRGRGLPQSSLPHRQQRPVADADGGGVDELAAVPLHPPVEQGAERRGQHPVGQHRSFRHPVDAGAPLVVEQVHREVVIVERGLDATAVEAPQVAAVAESLAVARGRQHGHVGRCTVPHAKRCVRRLM